MPTCAWRKWYAFNFSFSMSLTIQEQALLLITGFLKCCVCKHLYTVLKNLRIDSNGIHTDMYNRPTQGNKGWIQYSVQKFPCHSYDDLMKWIYTHECYSWFGVMVPEGVKVKVYPIQVRKYIS